MAAAISNNNYQLEKELIELTKDEQLIEQVANNIFKSIKEGLGHLKRETKMTLPPLYTKNGKPQRIPCQTKILTCPNCTVDPLVFNFDLGFQEDRVSPHFKNYQEQVKRYNNIGEEKILNANVQFLTNIVNDKLKDLLKEIDLKCRFRINNHKEIGTLRDTRLCCLDVIFWKEEVKIPVSKSIFSFKAAAPKQEPIEGTIELATTDVEYDSFSFEPALLGTRCSGFYKNDHHFNNITNGLYRWNS